MLSTRFKFDTSNEMSVPVFFTQLLGGTPKYNYDLYNHHCLVRNKTLPKCIAASDPDHHRTVGNAKTFWYKLPSSYKLYVRA